MNFRFLVEIIFVVAGFIGVGAVILALDTQAQLSDSRQEVYGLKYQVNSLQMRLNDKARDCELFRVKQVDIYEEGVEDILNTGGEKL